MKSQEPVSFDSFLRTHVRMEERLLIQSTCKACGRTKVVSSADGTLQDWENNHRCQKPSAPVQRPSPAA